MYVDWNDQLWNKDHDTSRVPNEGDKTVMVFVFIGYIFLNYKSSIFIIKKYIDGGIS